MIAILIIAALTIGFFSLATMPNSRSQKIDVLRVHMADGVLILALMVIRCIVRKRTARPAEYSLKTSQGDYESGVRSSSLFGCAIYEQDRALQPGPPHLPSPGAQDPLAFR